MVGEAEWTQEDILDTDRIRRVEFRIFNKSTGEILRIISRTVDDKVDRAVFVTETQAAYIDSALEDPNLTLHEFVYFVKY